jgi:hypothetical protein
MVRHVPTVKKQADDAKRLAKLLARMARNLKTRDAKSKTKLKIDTLAS